MTASDLGNQLNRIVFSARQKLFHQSELAQLTYTAFDISYRKIQEEETDTIEMSFPVGWTAERQPLLSKRKYTKAELLTQYQFLAFRQVATNGILHLVTIVEAMTEDLLRTVVAKYPQKLGKDRQISIGSVLESSTIEAIHSHAIDALLHELAYKSPAEFASAIDKQMSINPLECTAFHRYVELKATRDVHTHNRGFANKIYIRKAGHHARVKDGVLLPTDLQYFFESFEQVIQLTEWWEEQLHGKWHSSEFQLRKDNSNFNAEEGLSGQTDSVSQKLHELAKQQAKKDGNTKE